MSIEGPIASPFGEPRSDLIPAGDRLIGFDEAAQTIYAIDVFTGQFVNQTGGWPYQSQTGLDGPIAATAGMVFFVEQSPSGGPSLLQARKLHDGSVASDWHAPCLAGVRSLAGVGDVLLALCADERAGSQGGTVVAAFRVQDGAPAWPSASVTASAFGGGIPGLGPDAIYYVAQNRMFATNTGFGEVRFPKDLAAAPEFRNLDQARSPMVTAGAVVAIADGSAGNAGGLHAFDPRKGTLAWQWGGREDARYWAALNADATWIAVVEGDRRIAILDPATGAEICAHDLAPKLGGQPAVVRNEIHVIAAGKEAMTTFTADIGAKRLVRRDSVELPANISRTSTPVLANAQLFMPKADGNIEVRAFGVAKAALFDGTTFVDATPGAGTLALPVGDFTIEAWIRSSSGGVVVSAVAAASGLETILRVSDRGELCLMVCDPTMADLDGWASDETNAADGQWRHVAAIRQAGQVALFVDGVARRLYSMQQRRGVVRSRHGVAVDARNRKIEASLTPAPLPEPLACGGPSGLAIGGRPHAKDRSMVESWRGLLREVRIWDAAADAATLQSRMGNVLTAELAHLVGNWHLDEDLRNDVLGDEAEAAFAQGTFVVTDLLLQDSYPILLHQQDIQWPYSPRWSARGNGDVLGAPAVSDDGALCFRTTHGAYGVDRITGERHWSIPIDVRTSAPIAHGQAFYMLWSDAGLVRIDSQTGRYATPQAFAEVPPPAQDATVLCAPAHDGASLAVALPDGRVFVQDFAADDSAVEQGRLAPTPRALRLTPGWMHALCGTEGNWTLHVRSRSAAAPGQTLTVDAPLFEALQDWVFYLAGGKLVARDLSSDRAPATAKLDIAGRVTGLAADADDNLLVVTTSAGEVLGLGLATLGQLWKTRLPDGPHPVGAVLPPVVVDRKAFVASATGAVAALDGRTGQLRGMFQSTSGVIDAPVEVNGTVYLARAPGAAKAPLDGAVHSVAFGESYTLRLGLDPSGGPVEPGHAAIEADHALPFRDPARLTFEAWINTNAAGDILLLAPGQGGRPGLRVRVDGADTLLASLTWLNGAGWTQTQARALLPELTDRQWRHVAVVAAGPGDLRVFLDGRRFDATVTGGPATPGRLVAGTSVVLGGGGFRGLIADARLWDTSLTAHDIGERMHDRLRGDEANLAAWWTFDSAAVVDGSRRGFDGSLAGPAGGAAIWLTDLPFEHPSYPDIATQAVMTQQGEAGLPPGDPHGRTVYELKLSVRDGAGAPLAGRRLRLWYVRHEELGDPATIEAACGVATTSLPGLAPHDTEDNPADATGGRFFEVTTDPGGSVVVTITTTAPDHGPALDVWADFLPRHERYHVNVLLDGQLLSRYTPPTLAAQSKLIQDYHWSAGGEIDETRTRSTYQVVIRCCEADQTPRAHERLRLFGTGQLQIEVAGQAYTVNEHNSELFYTNTRGELTVVMEASDLNPPRLSISAGFMNPQARYVFDPAEDAHHGLTLVQGDDMLDAGRMTNWRKPDASGKDRSDRRALLGSDYKDQAGNIADTIRHVMSAAKAGPPQAAAPSQGVTAMALRAGRTAHAAAASHADMAQPFRMPRGDAIRALPTMRHIHRRAPLTPEFAAQSLAQAAPDAVGFHIAFDGAQKLSFTYLTKATAPTVLAQVLGNAPAHGPALHPMFGFGDIFSGIKHGFESVADHIAHIAVTVTDAIHVAINKLGDTVHIVVNSVEQAVSVVVDFIKQIALEIWMMIQFLLLLFNWGDILAAHRILKDCMRNSAQVVARELGDPVGIKKALAPLRTVFGGAAAPALDAGAWAPPSASGLNGQLLASVGSVGANSLRNKVEERAGDLDVKQPAPVRDFEDTAELVVSDFVNGLVDLATRLPHMSPSDFGGALLDLLKKVAADAVGGIVDALGDTVASMAQAMSSFLEALDKEIYIPLISEIYRWITGDDLSFLDLMCLFLGAGAHVACVIVTGKAFKDVAGGVADRLAAHGQGLRTMAATPIDEKPLPWGAGDDFGAEMAYMIFQAVQIGSVVGTDAMFLSEATSTSPSRLRSVFKIMRGATGLAANTLLFVCNVPYVAQRTAHAYNLAGMEPNDTSLLGIASLSWRDTLRLTATMSYAGSLLSNVFSLAGGAKGIGLRAPPQARIADIELTALQGGGPVQGGQMNDIGPSTFDTIEFGALSLVAYGIGVLDFVSICRGVVGKEYTNLPNADFDVKLASDLMLARNMLQSVLRLSGWMWNRQAYRLIRSPHVYAGAAIARATCNVGALGLHGGAMFGPLQIRP
jgi:outer membrane protein assembly factor BamB